MIEVRDLSFRYRKTQDLLFDSLSHLFVAGAVTAVTGESGRGKSTLLYVLGLMLKSESGSVLVDGRDTSHWSDSQRSAIRNEQLGFVFQDSVLDASRKIIDSVIEPALYRGQSHTESVPRATELLDRMGIGLRVDHLPGQISGGQAQRVALCRALMNRPNNILADEPTGNLDQANAIRVLDLLRDEARTNGITVVVATHDPLVISNADHVLKL